MDVRGLLLDAGGVLYRPRGGRWNPRVDFEEVVAAFDARLLDPARFTAAVAAGDRFLRAAPTTPPRHDYHRVVLAALGLEDPPAPLLAALDAPLDLPPVELYPEVLGVLAELRRRRLPVAIVSDNWSSARALVDRLGLGGLVDACVLSEEVGCNKPDPRIYAAGSAAIGVPPGACLFVDDDASLVEAAVALGYQGVALGRRRPHPPAAVAWIDGLEGVLDRC